MQLKGQQKKALEKAIIGAFPGYELDENAPQGQNTFCCNYRLTDPKCAPCLLKIILKDKVKNAVSEEQAMTEVEICKSVSGPYVLRALDVKSTAEHIFILLPFLDGSNLKEYSSEKVFTEAEIVEIGVSLLRGVSDLWRQQRIVHQDLKPENVFIERTGSVKILDFGSARFRKSPFKGSSRTNFAYSSPEQILASRPGSAELSRITLDDRVDVYAIGLILYSLIEGSHPFSGHAASPADAIFDAAPVPDFSRTDVSDGLKRVVLKMLDTNMSSRPNANTAVIYLENGDVTPAKLQNGGFYYSIINGINRFLKMNHDMPDLFDGVVVDASQVPDNSEEKVAIRTAVKTFLIDPQTYLFQKPKHQSQKFQKLPYFAHETLFQDMPSFLRKVSSADPEIIGFIDAVCDHQVSAGVTAITPPFLYIQEFNDETWGIDQGLADLAINQMLSKHSKLKPIVKGVAISQEILTSDLSRNRLLSYLTSLSDRVDGYMVLLDSVHSTVVVDEPWLKGARDLFTKLLGTGKYVIWNRSDISGIVLSSSTGVSISVGEMLKQRRFNIIEEVPDGPRRKVPTYYVESLFARATWPDAFEGLASYHNIDKFHCPDACCAAIDFQNGATRTEADLATHMMHTVGKQFKKYTGAGSTKIVADIEQARAYYGELKSHPDLIVKEAFKKNIKPESVSFLESWLNTLNS